jgi:hypothetical protein
MEWSLLQHSFHCSASALLLLQYRVDHRDAAVGRLVLLPPQCIDACGCNPRLSSPAAVKTKGTVSHPSCPQVSTARIGANIAASLAISISKCSQKKKNWTFCCTETYNGSQYPGLALGTSESLSQRISVQMNGNGDLPSSKKMLYLFFIPFSAWTVPSWFLARPCDRSTSPSTK